MFIKNTKRGLLLLSQQKKQKCFFYLGFFAARAFTLQSGQNHGLESLPLCFARANPALLQNIPMPLPTAHSHQVLPTFTRS